MLKETCPVCNGSCRRPVPEDQQRYKNIYSGYDKETDTLPCTNCGGQYMYGRPTGEVRVNNQGDPCTHSYTSKTVGRCLTEHSCAGCGDRYQIDSGD